MRKAKVHLELNLSREVKASKSTFHKQQESRKNVSLLLNDTGALVMQDMEKDDVLKTAFSSIFTSKICLPESQRAEGKSGARKTHPWWKMIRPGNT